MGPKNRLIVALDVDTQKKALDLCDKLKGEVVAVKIGSELFSSCGPSVVEAVIKNGVKVFLDLKFHDIPNTVSKAVLSATRLGVFMVNVHALGGYEMMKKASESVMIEAQRMKIEKPKLIAVTILTSMDEKALKKVGIDDNINREVLRLAVLAKDAGLDGVVASPKETALIRQKLGKDFIIVTPGVRPTWTEAQDQKRIATPADAIRDGASFIVVGRPVIEAPDPAGAARRILKEIGQ
ncbi:MAG: orotidine-5'-phosphate decarboxylase [Candidatus Omnitrophica bacterium]|nr:orotidine-5'-phosphate decarboxylase [Candidatus Omnitrophota bacterium]MCM8791380.1 orotidine-5'-phosphate decarboxylase [Candidatus Omnitrophota bacterium]